MSTSHYVHCPFSPGVSIQWEATEYRVNEDIATVQLRLLKKGLSSYNVTVTVTTQDSSANGMHIIYLYMHCGVVAVHVVLSSLRATTFCSTS